MAMTNWIVRTRAHSRLRLFCFPYAGGGASIYRQWSNRLPSEVEVCPIYLPGREARIQEPLFTQISPLIETLSHALRPYLDQPFAFFGHSLGALIAFELTRHLRLHHLPTPQALFVSAHRAPQYPRRDATLHPLPDPEFIDEIKKLGGTPEAVIQHEELMKLLLPIIRADFTIYETYVYREEPPLAYPIYAFGGEQDHTLSREDMEGWHTQTSGTFSLRMLSGGHFFLHDLQDLLLLYLSQDLNLLLQHHL